MIQYLRLLTQCLNQGARQKNRTGVDTFMIPGGMMQFNLEDGFPILTTKHVAFNQVKGELLGFIRGCTNAEDFRRLGCTIWDANANQNKAWLGNPNRRGTDDLGRIYGAQWRNWRRGIRVNGGDEEDPIDQLAGAIHTINLDPTSRRIIVSAWRPDEMSEMALPPCHLLYQFLVAQEAKRLDLCMYMRSCDMFLGVPFNISSYALLLFLISMVTGYKPGILTMFLADVHIYENHLDQVREQIARSTRELPKLQVNASGRLGSVGLALLERLDPKDIQLVGYDPHPAIKGEMAV